MGEIFHFGCFPLLKKFRDVQLGVAPEIKLAAEADDQELAVRLAHTLKGLAGNIGALALFDTARDLEAALNEKKPWKKLLAAVSKQLDALGEGMAVLGAEEVTAAPAAPIDKDEAAKQLKRHDPDLVVLHCMGFNREHRRIFRQITGKPAIVANSMVARTVAELLEP